MKNIPEKKDNPLINNNIDNLKDEKEILELKKIINNLQKENKNLKKELEQSNLKNNELKKIVDKYEKEKMDDKEFNDNSSLSFKKLKSAGIPNLLRKEEIELSDAAKELIRLEKNRNIRIIKLSEKYNEISKKEPTMKLSKSDFKDIEEEEDKYTKMILLTSKSNIRNFREKYKLDENKYPDKIIRNFLFKNNFDEEKTYCALKGSN